MIAYTVNSKKDPEVRAKEILNEASPLLIDTVAKKAPVLMREKLSSQVVQEILLHATGKIYTSSQQRDMIFMQRYFLRW